MVIRFKSVRQNNIIGLMMIYPDGHPRNVLMAERFQHVVEKYNRIYRVQLPKITPHVCRHTFCTNAAKRGISVETLKYLMGHTDISVTSNVYTHLKLEDAQREMERLERVEKEMKKCAK